MEERLTGVLSHKISWRVTSLAQATFALEC